ncbi:MAG TPA: TolC family protein [Mucilaginibacter sp.]|nr:TolC family protein [Mucilaginibacter sp.]
MNFKAVRKRVLVALILVTGSIVNASAQQVISLQKAVELALANNLNIKQAKYTEQLATEDYKQAKNNMLPSLTVNPQASYNFGRSPNLTTYSYTSQSFLYVNGQAAVSLTLFQGGQLRNQILENKLLLDVDKTSTEKIKNDLLLNVVTDYLQILTNQDLVTAAQQQVDLAKITLTRTQANFDAGSQSLADLSQAKAGVSTAELNLTTAQNQLDLSILVLKQYMEMDPNTDIKIEKPDISKLNDIRTAYDAGDVIKTALNVNPDVKLAEVQEQGYAQAVKVARSSYFPTVSLFGGIGSNYSSISQNLIGVTNVEQQIGVVQGTNTPVVGQFTAPVYSSSYSFFNQIGNNFNQSVGVSIQIPIFTRFQARTSVRKAKLNYENAEVATQLAKNTLSKTIIQAVLDLNASVRRYASAQQTYQADKDAFDVIQQRFDVGLVNSLDYNTALTNYEKSENDMIEAKYEVIFRSKVIDYYLGNQITL